MAASVDHAGIDPPGPEIAMTHREETMGLPKPRSVEESIDVESIDGMRRAILRGALIRECFGRAQSRLLNREEIYVLLAYEALVKLEELDQIRESLKQERVQSWAGADPDGHF